MHPRRSRVADGALVLTELCSNLGSKHQLCDTDELLRGLKLGSVDVKQAIFSAVCRAEER